MFPGVALDKSGVCTAQTVLLHLAIPENETMSFKSRSCSLYRICNFPISTQTLQYHCGVKSTTVPGEPSKAESRMIRASIINNTPLLSIMLQILRIYQVWSSDDTKDSCYKTYSKCATKGIYCIIFYNSITILFSIKNSI